MEIGERRLLLCAGGEGNRDGKNAASPLPAYGFVYQLTLPVALQMDFCSLDCGYSGCCFGLNVPANRPPPRPAQFIC